jgi:tetratricopeptide (TPR) repeat protein
MKDIRLIVILLNIILLVGCSSNKVETPQVKEKTPIDLAVESANEAKLAYDNSDFEGAIDKYNQAINYYQQALPTAAAVDSVALQIFRLNKNIANIHAAYGYVLADQNAYDEAIIQYEAAIDKYKSLTAQATPDDSLTYVINNLYRNTAVASKDAGEYEKALNYYDLLLAANPEEDDILLKKFAIYKDDLKNETQAYEILKAYANSKNDFGASHRLGDLYKEKGDIDNAILWYEKANSIKTDSNVLIKLGNIYRNPAVKQWEKSNVALEKYVILNPLSPDLKTVYKLIGDNYDKLKNKAKTMEYYDKILAMEYDEQISLYACNYYYGLKKYTKVISYATTILDKNSNNTTARYFRALSRYELKDMKGAKADFELIKNDPQYGKTVQGFLKTIK